MQDNLFVVQELKPDPLLFKTLQELKPDPLLLLNTGHRGQNTEFEDNRSLSVVRDGVCVYQR